MRIQFGTLVLCTGNIDGPMNLVINGQSVVDEEQFFRAAAASFFPRGGRSMAISFTVQQVFATDRLAQTFLLTHPDQVPTDGDLAITVGVGSDVQTYTMAKAVCDSVQPQLRGRRVRITYALRGTKFV